jgi:ribonuclease Z
MQETAQRFALWGFCLTLLFAVAAGGSDRPPVEKPTQGDGTTKVVLLGTGTPNPDPQHSGCSLAIVVNHTPYIVDFGPGLVRQAAALSPSWGGELGYPDLILTPWVIGRDEPLEVWGPDGIIEMTKHILAAYREDIRYRSYGQEPANDQGWRVNAHELEEGVVYTDDNVKVEAFPVKHGTWPNAWGFRFTTADKVIVISGDARPSESVVKYAKGADILLHEVYSHEKWAERTADWRQYHAEHHTSTLELGKIAAQAKPGLVVLYHTLDWGATNDEMLAEIATVYDGEVIVGHDLQIIE